MEHTSKRGELLKKLSEKGISFDTRLICSGRLKGMTDSIKEERAGHMLSMLQESKTEQEFILKIVAKWH